MAAFIFRLETLLNQKLDALKAAQRLVAEKRRYLDAQQAELLRLMESEAALKCQVKSMREAVLPVSGAGTVVDVHRRGFFLEGLQQDWNTAQSATLVQKFATEEAQAALEFARRQMVECSREAEKLKKYRQKLAEEFAAELANKEEIEQDEMGMVMYLNRKVEQ